MIVFVPVAQGVPLIALQECGPRGAVVVREALGEGWACHAGDATDCAVATFWDTTVATII